MSCALLRLDKLACERDRRPLFAGLNASFERGELVQITGENGSGKTTLLRVIAGLSSDYEGEIHWLGKRHRHWQNDESLPQRLFLGHKVGVVLALSPLENLSWYFGLNPCFKSSEHDDFNQILSEALDKVGLSAYQDVPCAHLSAGQQRRVALARLFVSAAPVWILDEPFTAIDVKGADLLTACIQEHSYNNNGLVILTSHQALAFKGLRQIDLADFKCEGVNDDSEVEIQRV